VDPLPDPPRTDPRRDTGTQRAADVGHRQRNARPLTAPATHLQARSTVRRWVGVVHVWKEQGYCTSWPWNAACHFNDTCDCWEQRSSWWRAYGLARQHARLHAQEKR
jgi:hypothetical protein